MNKGFVLKPQNVVVRALDDGNFVVLNAYSGESFTFDKSAGIFLQCIHDYPQSFEDLLQNVACKFVDVDAECICADLEDFLTSLKQNNLILWEETIKKLNYPSLTYLHVELTTQCNERCIHCYLPNALKQKERKWDIDELFNLIDDFVVQGGQDITLSGGDPFMHEGFMEIVRYCHLKKLNIHIFSNLLKMSDEVINELKQLNVVEVQASVYSLKPAIHDKITRVRDSLQHTLTAIQHLLNAHIPVAIACPIMRDNYKEIAPLVRFAKRNGITLRTNSLILPQCDGNDEFAKAHTLTIDERREVLEDIMNEDADYAIANVLQLNDKVEQLQTNATCFMCNRVCSVGSFQVCVDPEGYVFPCPDWKTFKLGNVKEQSLSNIWRNSESLKLLRQINQEKNFHKCLGCDAINYCKRCLMMNDFLGKGELLRCHKSICDYAKLVKDAVEQHKNHR